MTISFKDNKGMCNVTLETRNDSIALTGERNGSCGQIDLEPNTYHQELLAKVWKKLHIQNLPKLKHMEGSHILKDFPGLIDVEILQVTLYIQSLMNRIQEEDNARRLQEYADKKTESGEDVDEKALALIQYLGEDPEAIIDVVNAYDNDYNLNGETYRILTNEEAEYAWDEELESYIDDCILPEIDNAYSNYFNRAAWKNDARIDGRGHSLSHYDGEEHCETINGTDYYLYKN